MAPFPPWEDLHPELLSAIAEFLEQNSIDILRFRSACHSWFSNLSPPRSRLSPPLPLRITSPPPPLRTRRYLNRENFVLSATAVFAIRPIGGGGGVRTGEESGETAIKNNWIAFVDELNPGRVSVREPFSKKHHEMALDFPRRMDVVDLHVSEIGRFYNLTAVSNQDGRFARETDWSGDVQKIVLLSDGSALLVLFEVGRLGLLKLGGGEGNVGGMGSDWQIIHNGKKLRFDDIIEYKGKLLGIDRRGKVYDVGSYPLDMNAIVGPITRGGGRRKRLIESLGMLHLVVRWFDYGPAGARMGRFKVYVMNEARKKWVEISNLSDRIFLFGQDFSFSASAEDLEGFVGTNCIAYFHLSFEKYVGANGESWLRQDSRLYTSQVGVYELAAGARPHAIESHPGYSDTLGMHLNWLWPNKKSKLLGVLEAAIDRLFSRFYLVGIIDEDLKAKYRSLSPLVEAIVSGDGISQEDTRSIKEQADTLKLYLIDLTTMIEDEIKFVKKSIAGEAWTRQPEALFNNVLNQGGTFNPTLGAEDTNGCLDTDLNAWLSREMTRRLGTHFELLVLLRGIKGFVEEKLEDRRMMWNLGNKLPSLG